MAADRACKLVQPDAVFVATNESYASILHSQAPTIPLGNFILEPARRDVAAAVALAFFTLHKEGRRGPVLFLWTDSYIRNEDILTAAVSSAEDLVIQDGRRLVFIGEKPRFPNENLGWIELGERLGVSNGLPYYSFLSWHYRPSKPMATRMFSSGNYVWNSGYFVSSVEFIVEVFRRLAPELSSRIDEIVEFRGTSDWNDVLRDRYPSVPELHFDEAILEKLPSGEAFLLPVELGWSDPGSLYSLKEALQDSAEATVTIGDVVARDTKDSLLYNENSGKLLAAMGVEGVIVVETDDVTLVIHKDSVRHLGELLEQLKNDGWDAVL
jgi:mannose-1-phosphate guanylyltransferase